MQNARVRSSSTTSLAALVLHSGQAVAFPLSIHHLRLLRRRRRRHHHLLPLPPPPPPRKQRNCAASLPPLAEFVAPTGSHVPINGVLPLVGRAVSNPPSPRFSVSLPRAPLPSSPVSLFPPLFRLLLNSPSSACFLAPLSFYLLARRDPLRRRAYPPEEG